ncbi:MAG TPA: hypothetical protein VKK79_04425, partial [Candidatus Lokiarchaeia archaeon]|nr:hypothetical protein [Candidatus Lokiarchaeia archaeon]
KGQFNATANTDDLLLQSAGFYLLSLEGVASAIYASSNADAPDLVMIYETLSLQLINAGSGNVLQKQCDMSPSYQFLGEDGQSVNYYHCLNFIDGDGNLLTYFLTSQTSGVTYHALNPGTYLIQVCSSPLSILLFGSNNFPWWNSNVSQSQPWKYPAFDVVKTNLPYYVSTNNQGFYRQDMDFSSGSLEFAGIRYKDNAGVAEANLNSTYVAAVNWTDYTTTTVAPADWRVLFYAMFIRSVDWGADFILQLGFLAAYVACYQLGWAAFLETALTLLFSQLISMFLGVQSNIRNPAVTVFTTKVHQSLAEVAIENHPGVYVFERYSYAKNGETSIRDWTSGIVEEETPVYFYHGTQVKGTHQQDSPISNQRLHDIGNFLKKLLGIDDLRKLAAQALLIFLATVFLLAVDSNRFYAQYNPAASPSNNIFVPPNPASVWLSPYDMVDSVFSSVFFGVNYVIDKIRFMPEGVITDFIIAFLVAALVRYFVVIFTYYIKIWIIQANAQALNLDGAIAQGIVPKDWDNWRDYIDILWPHFKDVNPWAFWGVNLLFNILTNAVPLVVGAIIFGYMSAGAIGTELVSEGVSIIINPLKQVVEGMIIDRLSSILGDIATSGLSNLFILNGISAADFNKWSFFS